ncbi:MAG: response regulator transcription factor [Lentisphaerota bacterium]
MKAKKSEDPTKTKKLVFIVDDHPLIRESLQQMINAEPDLHVCGEASGYQEALQRLETVRPDAMIVDLGLKDVSGLELLREIKLRMPQTNLLVLSMFDEQSYAPKCLKAGARGYVMKSDPPAKVLEALRMILQGEIFLSPALTHRIMRQAVGDQPVMEDSVVDELTHRELEVFRMLGNGYSTVEISRKLNLSRKTIQTYREHIKVKLNIPHASGLIRRATQWAHEQQTGTPAPLPERATKVSRKKA